MPDIDEWLQLYAAAVKRAFGGRIKFIGIQGSYARGEANENSDIDVVLILDELSPEDLKLYRESIAGLPEREKICGFVSGAEELMGWETSDILQFYFETTAIEGSLVGLLPRPDRGDAERAVRIGAGNIYHIAAHNFLHGRKTHTLKGLYKSAVFVLQARYYLKTGEYISKKSDLMKAAAGGDAEILRLGSEIRAVDSMSDGEMEKYTAALLGWAGGILAKNSPSSSLPEKKFNFFG